MSPRMMAEGMVTAVASQELNSPKDEGEVVGVAATTTRKQEVWPEGLTWGLSEIMCTQGHTAGAW